MTYGDVLRYPLGYDPDDSYRFMYVGKSRILLTKLQTIRVMILRVPSDDDLWAVGKILTAGVNELEVVDAS